IFFIFYLLIVFKIINVMQIIKMSIVSICSINHLLIFISLTASILHQSKLKHLAFYRQSIFTPLKCLFGFLAYILSRTTN
ncbi:MAG: hypothetical protein CSA96_06900, partial [Bacteroidetes bacterium]